MSSHCEIEKKYLIAWIEPAELHSKPGCAVWEIEQVYLSAEPGTTRRIRRVVEDGEKRYYKTFKRRLSAMSAEEEEGMISRADYEGFLKAANPDQRPILKTRYRIPYEGQILEFDLYPFWSDRAVMEIELESEAQQVYIPDWVRVLKDVTGDRRYSNFGLALEIPMEEVGL